MGCAPVAAEVRGYVVRIIEVFKGDSNGCAKAKDIQSPQEQTAGQLEVEESEPDAVLSLPSVQITTQRVRKLWLLWGPRGDQD